MLSDCRCAELGFIVHAFTATHSQNASIPYTRSTLADVDDSPSMKFCAVLDSVCVCGRLSAGKTSKNDWINGCRWMDGLRSGKTRASNPIRRKKKNDGAHNLMKRHCRLYGKALRRLSMADGASCLFTFHYYSNANQFDEHEPI